MGASISCHGPECGALHNKPDGLISRTISFNDPDSKNIDGTLSSDGRDPEHSILKALGSGRITIEGSLSFKGMKIDQFQVHTTFSKDSTSAEEKDSSRASSFKSSVTDATDQEQTMPFAAEAGNPNHEAAVKLQKVYKSFRTRRQLADCAVLVEQRWWRLLDFALLKQSSISYFNIEKPESVASRWSRARTRAAKVGKGLSKDEKAQKLALQHWLEAIDPRHRYGHNLHFYYASWLRCESRQPFFYWLDVGDGKEVNLERCPRSKLQQQCIKYLGPKERKAYEVIVEGGKLIYQKNGELLDTSDDSKDSKWIFVLSTSKKLYVGKKKKGKFQHSSFLAGAATSSAGRLVVEKGVLKAVWPHSGHYRPTEENFQEFVAFLNDNEVDLSDVKKHQTEGDDDDTWSRTASATHTRTDSYQLDLVDDIATFVAENFDKEDDAKMEFDLNAQASGVSGTTGNDIDRTFSGSCSSPSIKSQLEQIESSKKEEAFDDLYALCAKELLKGLYGESDEDGEDATNGGDVAESTSSSDSGGKTDHSESLLKNQQKDIEAVQLPSASEKCYRFQKLNLFEDLEEKEEPVVPQELILHRMNSKKGMKSLQLGRQLSCKWTTGAGPRIGCVRDYPSELQFRALEQVSLSPRSAGEPKCFASSPRSTSKSNCRISSSSTEINIQQ